MSEEPKTFIVNDRRTFTAEGERRGDGVSPEESNQQTAQVDAGSAPDGVEPLFPEEPVDLISFALSQAVNARMLLTQPPEQLSAAKALAGVRYLISVLEMLQSRTQGNRTDQESTLLDGLLFDLRIAFVEKSRESGR
jgi:hypothetical protein